MTFRKDTLRDALLVSLAIILAMITSPLVRSQQTQDIFGVTKELAKTGKYNAKTQVWDYCIPAIVGGDLLLCCASYAEPHKFIKEEIGGSIEGLKSRIGVIYTPKDEKPYLKYQCIGERCLFEEIDKEEAELMMAQILDKVKKSK